MPSWDAVLDAVQIGDRYFQIGLANNVWQVERFCTPTMSDVPHVVLSRKGRIPDSKIISVEALLDGEEFRIDKRTCADNLTSHRRRRRDVLNAA